VRLVKRDRVIEALISEGAHRPLGDRVRPRRPRRRSGQAEASKPLVTARHRAGGPLEGFATKLALYELLFGLHHSRERRRRDSPAWAERAYADLAYADLARIAGHLDAGL